MGRTSLSLFVPDMAGVFDGGQDYALVAYESGKLRERQGRRIGMDPPLATLTDLLIEVASTPSDLQN